MFKFRVAGKIPSALATLALVAGLGITGTAPASAACGTTWGSLEKISNPYGYALGHVNDVRTGRHDCFDRMVINLDGKVDGYTVRYVDEFTNIGGGPAIPLSGNADLSVTVNAPAYEGSHPTYGFADANELVNVTGYQTFRQLAWGGSYEAQTLIGLGVRARLPFRAFVLDGPGGGARLVIDVAHYWT